MTTSAPVRNSMRQTATVERTATGALNPLGQPTAGGTSTRTLACRAWEATQDEVTSDGRWLTLSRWKMRVPLGADIAEDDRRHDRKTCCCWSKRLRLRGAVISW